MISPSASTHHSLEHDLFSNLTSFAQLEQRLSALPDAQVQKQGFELLAEGFLALRTLPQAVEIVPRHALTAEIKHRLSIPDTLTAADGFFRTQAGELYPYHIVFQPAGSNAILDNPQPFLDLIARTDNPLLFTNCHELPKVLRKSTQFQCILGGDLEPITAEWFQSFRGWRHGAAPLPPRPLPAVYLPLAEELAQIQAGPSRKTTVVISPEIAIPLVSLYLAENLGSQRTMLVLLSSLDYLNDLTRLWRHCSAFSALSGLWVHDAKSTTQNGHCLPGDLDVPLTTEVDGIRKFLGCRFPGVRVVFATYGAMGLITRAQLGYQPFILTLFPEGQRVANIEKFLAESAQNHTMPASQKQLFLTTTAERIDLKKKDGEGEFRPFFSMNTAELFGPITVLATLPQAVAQQTARNWQVLVVLISADIEEASTSNLAVSMLQLGLARYADLNRIHTRLPFTKGTSITIANTEPFTIHNAEHLQSIRQRDRVYQATRQSVRSILRLGQGTDIGLPPPSADLVLFPVGSTVAKKLDWLQALQPLLSPRADRPSGFAVVPLVMRQGSPATLSPDWDYADALLWILQSFCDIDADFKHAVHQTRRNKGQTGKWQVEPLQAWIEILGQVGLDDSPDIIQATDMIAQCVERLTSPWEEHLGALIAFREAYGHSEVPSGWADNPELSRWVDQQRKARSKEVLSAEKQHQLNALDFIWDPQKTAWERMFQALQTYKNATGDCKVPKAWPGNPALGEWVEQQREDQQRKRLDSECQQRLDALGFVWDLEAAQWEENYRQLELFKNLHGHAWIKEPFPQNPEMGDWAARQRRERKRGRLASERIHRLDQVAFVWDLEAADWAEMFEHFLHFKELYGHGLLYLQDKRHPKLADWAEIQRREWRLNRLDPNYYERLQAAGFVWDLSDALWQEMLQTLQKFKRHHGHCTVPAVEAPDLHQWTEEQRKNRRSNRLHPTYINRLNALGFVWDSRVGEWEEMFTTFRHIKLCQGHGCIPDNFPLHPNLGQWAKNLRRDQLKGTLDADREARLRDAGFVFDLEAAQWEASYRALRRYWKTYGDTDVADSWPENPGLADWVNLQRRMYRSGRMSDNQVQKLNAVDFLWDPSDKLWQVMFIALKQFYENNQHFNVPPDGHEPAELFSWTRKQRTLKIKGALPTENFILLDTLGFPWEAKEATWQEMLAALLTFVNKRKHCVVPAKFPENPRLAKWVDEQRREFKKGNLPKDKTDRLHALGFVWDAKSIFWEEMFVALTEYLELHGDCLVPENYQGNPQLSWWVAAQRKAKQAQQLEPERVTRLEALAFIWDTHEAQWLNMYRSLFAFHQKHGHCLIPKNGREDPALASWCDIQRQARTHGNLDDGKVYKLASLGFIWDAKEVVVEGMLMQLADFKTQYGHCNVPAQWAENPALGLWVQFQRQSLKKGTLDQQRYKRLEDMGFVWD